MDRRRHRPWSTNDREGCHVENWLPWPSWDQHWQLSTTPTAPLLFILALDLSRPYSCWAQYRVPVSSTRILHLNQRRISSLEATFLSIFEFNLKVTTPPAGTTSAIAVGSMPRKRPSAKFFAPHGNDGTNRMSTGLRDPEAPAQQ